MKYRHRLLMLCLQVTLVGPHAASLCCGDEPLIVEAGEAGPPVVTGPVLPPVPLMDVERAAPRHTCDSGFALQRLRSSAGPSGNASGRPFGAFNNALFGTQVANGVAAQMVLYRYDFVPGRAMLAPAGKRKLVRMAPVLAQTPFRLIVEPSRSEPDLDDARRGNVIRTLAQLAYPLPDEQVVVASPPARGMNGTEARRVQQIFEVMTGETPNVAPVTSGLP